MAFKCRFYAFSKRVNSTKIPDVSYTELDIILKAGSSAINPAISCDFGQGGNPTGFNYCYIPEFNRYYFVGDWIYDARLWHAQCVADPMASFKTNIGTYHAYILRSASSYNTRVIDNYYPAIAKNTHAANTITSPFVDDGTGSYVIGIMGRDAGDNGGAVTYYVATPSQMRTLVRFMMQSVNYDVDDISEHLLMCIFNPLQYIVSCMYFPFIVPRSNIGGVYFGWWTATGTDIGQLAGLKTGSNLTFTIPKHPKAATRGQYLNLPPYSRYKLEAGPWGIIPLDNFNLIDTTSLSVLWNVDLMTGTGRLSVKFRDQLVHETIHTAQIGVPVQLGQNMFNQGALEGAAGGIGSIITNAITGNPAGMLTSGVSAIGDAAKLTQSIPSTLGSNGTMAFNNSFAITADFLDVVDEDITSHGRPLCEARTINTLSGYIMCEDADPAIPCTDQELKTIVNYMNSGFYYE